MNPKKSERLVVKYDDWHRTQHSAGSGTELFLSQWHIDAMKLAPPLGDTAVLEVGCGAGDFALYLSSQARAVTAVDFSPAAIGIAQEKGTARKANVDFQVADAQALPFTDAVFDVVFSCECLEHLPNPQQGLREMCRVLKPGGQLLLTTENYANAMIIYWMMAWLSGKPFNSGAGVQPIENFFLFWRVKRLMAIAGFQVERMIGAHHVFLVIPGCHPHLFVRERFRTKALAGLFSPIARHTSFKAVKK